MPLILPKLDDRSYADLVEEARALIPAHAPEWTHHNPADPGITLVELFAYLAEMLIYRLNRVTDANVHAFLKLLNGPEWKPSPDKPLSDEIRETVLALREPNRAVSSADFERLARAADARVARARCLPRRDLESTNPSAEENPGYVSVVIVPFPSGTENTPRPDPLLIDAVKKYLEPRCLLTTRVKVAAPRYVTVGVRLTLTLRTDALEAEVRDRAIQALQRFLHPLEGGPEANGWPFGRNVYVSEIYALLDQLPGVDFVTKTGNFDELIVTDPARRIPSDPRNELIAVEIRPDELIDARVTSNDITIITPKRT